MKEEERTKVSKLSLFHPTRGTTCAFSTPSNLGVDLEHLHQNIGSRFKVRSIEPKPKYPQIRISVGVVQHQKSKIVLSALENLLYPKFETHCFKSMY